MLRHRALPFVSICVFVFLALSCGGGGGGGAGGSSGASGATVVPVSNVSSSNNNSYGFSKNESIVVSSSNSGANTLETPAFAKKAQVQSTKTNTSAKGEGIYSEAIQKLGIAQINLQLTIDGVTSEYNLGANDALVLKQVTPGTKVVASGTVTTGDNKTRKIVQKEYSVEAFQDTLPLFIEYEASLLDSLDGELNTFVYSTDKPIVLPVLNDITVDDGAGGILGVAPFLGWQVSAPNLSVHKNFYPKGATVPAGELCGDIKFKADYGFVVYQFNSNVDDLYIEDTGIEMSVGQEVDILLSDVNGNPAFFDSATVTNGAIATFTKNSATEGAITANALGNTIIVVEGKSWRGNNYSVQIPVVVGDVVFNQAYYDAHDDFDVKSAKHLVQIAELASNSNNFAGKTITLESSLDLSGTDFNGINITSGFMGTFDGNDKSVTVSITGNASELGFISALGSTGEVKNLTVKGKISNTMTTGSVAGIVGNNSGKISGCTNEATFSGASNSAGIAVTNNGVIQECSNTANLAGEEAAGIVRNNKGMLEECVNSGTITGKDGAGGIAVTTGNGSNISHCLNSGTVKATNSNQNAYAGGIVSEHTMNGGAITNCTNTADVTSSAGRAGGIAGSSSNTITNCYNTGNITGDYAGGIAGKGNTIEWCYNKGDITGTSYCGGVVGSIDGSLTNCYAMNCTVKETATNAGAVYGSATNGTVGTVTHLNVKNSSNVTWANGVANFNALVNTFTGSSFQKVGYEEYDFH